MGLKAENSLSEKDWEFVKLLTRVAYVHVLSHQVVTVFTKDNRDTDSDKENSLIFPQNWSLQYVGVEPSKYEDKHSVRMTWEVFDE